MNSQYQYLGQVLTSSISQELIQELFAGRTLQRKQIIRKVDEVHRERGGLPPRSQGYHPAELALSKMKRSELAENPERGLWFIKLPLIKTPGEFIKWAQKFGRGEYVFRGVSNEKYRIQASAFRRPKKDRDFEKFLQVNKDLIRDARLRGYHQRDGLELKSLEILAELQHHGAATCLIDFTYNAQVALRFACKEDSKKPRDSNETQNQKNQQNLKNPPNGKVFAVRKNPPSRFRGIVPKLLEEDIDFFLQDSEESQLYCWQPRQQNNRIIAQQSIFLFGRYEFVEDDACIIEGSSKEDIINVLQQVSGITEDSLFPDFEGFAYVRREEAPYTELTASQYKDRGFQTYDMASERSDYENAIADFDIVIDLQPRDAVAHYLRGSANRQLERYEDARADFDMAIDLDSDYANAYRDRGFLNYHLERYEDARADFDMAIDLDPYDAEAHRGSGLTNYQLELYQDALVDFDEAIRLQSNNADGYHYRGIVRAQLRQIRDALVDFDEAIRLQPNNAIVYFNRALMKVRTFQHSRAVLDFDEVIRIDPNNAEAYYYRAGSKLRLNLLDAAKEDLLKASPLAVRTSDKELIEDIDNMLDEINVRISRGSQDE